MSDTSIRQDPSPGRYEIRTKGHLDRRWAAWFDELSLIREADGTTVIHSPVLDQAALYGVLQKLRDLGLPLLSVTQVEPDQPEVSTLDPRWLIHTPRSTDMANNVRTARTHRVPMDSTRKTSLVAGIFYLITFTSIPTLGLYGSLTTDRHFILSSGGSTGVLWGAFLEVIVALAGIGTAVTLALVHLRQDRAGGVDSGWLVSLATTTPRTQPA